MHDIYRSWLRDTKCSISADRIALLEKEALELADAFKQDRFKGYRVLKLQHRKRTKTVMPLVKDFTDHYRAHYQLGDELPLDVASYDLPACPSDDFDAGLRSLNANRAPGHDNCAPEYIKRGGLILRQWLFVLMTRIWTFTCDLPLVDRIGCSIPIPKKTRSMSVDSTRPICLLTSIYKLYATTTGFSWAWKKLCLKTIRFFYDLRVLLPG